MQITYNNKSFLNQNPSIPNANKVTDDDMNEIKNVVNANYLEEKSDIANLYYEPGDEIEIGGVSATELHVTNGYISSSTQSVFVTLNTPKRLDNINSIAVNNLNVEARGVQGYLNSTSGYIEYTELSDYTITAWVSSPKSITLRLQKSSAFTNATNNTPVSLDGYFKFTLS